MVSTSPSHGLVGDRAYFGRPYLTSPRAHAACTREFARLSDAVLGGIATLDGAMQDVKATVRRSPDRCIVQLGPVALTFAWLRGNGDSVASGELLVIVWRGLVAPRIEHTPERPSKMRAPLGAVSLWEQVLGAAGESEQTWGWQTAGEETARCSSIDLAARCVGRLRAAYLDATPAPPPTRDAATIA